MSSVTLLGYDAFFIFHCFAVEPTTKMTLSHSISKTQILNLHKGWFAIQLKRTTLCQSLTEFLFEKENHFKQLDRWISSMLTYLFMKKTPNRQYPLHYQMISLLRRQRSGPMKTYCSFRGFASWMLGRKESANQLVPAASVLQRWCPCRGGVLDSMGRSRGIKQHDKIRSQQLVLFYVCICIIRFYMIKLLHKVAVMKL